MHRKRLSHLVVSIMTRVGMTVGYGGSRQFTSSPRHLLQLNDSISNCHSACLGINHKDNKNMPASDPNLKQGYILIEVCKALRVSAAVDVIDSYENTKIGQARIVIRMRNIGRLGSLLACFLLVFCLFLKVFMKLTWSGNKMGSKVPNNFEKVSFFECDMSRNRRLVLNG